MTDREKLNELCEDVILSCKASLCADCEHNNIDYPHCMGVHFADHLLSNGVTFATDNNVGGKWIPVTERLPEQYESVVAWTMYGEMGEVEHDGSHFLWAYDNDFAAVTHWMPFPEPPKEGE